MAIGVDRGDLVLDQDSLLQPGAEVVTGPGIAVSLPRNVVFELAAQFEADNVLHGPAVQNRLELGADHVVGWCQNRLQLHSGRLVADALEGGDLGHLT
jgi:hypothetical protein